jgi:hypothetical protein
MEKRALACGSILLLGILFQMSWGKFLLVFLRMRIGSVIIHANGHKLHLPDLYPVALRQYDRCSPHGPLKIEVRVSRDIEVNIGRRVIVVLVFRPVAICGGMRRRAPAGSGGGPPTCTPPPVMVQALKSKNAKAQIGNSWNSIISA